ncbi:kinase-like domain-containing protein [Mucidula mucida]|nr:kinase-like domain-containing protein [Mucidula mucida]
MFSDADAAPPSPAATATDNDGVGALTTWQPIFHASNQVVLYNPTSHAIAIRASSIQPHERHCPYCKQTVPPAFHPEPEIHDNDFDDDYAQSHSRASNYFHLLAIANDTWSRPSTPPSPIEPGDNAEAGPSTFSRDSLAHGYFKTFFTEEQKLGMGANGSVYLCQHVLDGNPLGHFAVKKVAVGQSHSYLMNILREVRLLERLHHPNIITYHHSWLETTQFSSFGPKVPTLHILMQWAEGGSLDDFIDVRLGRETHAHISPSSPGANTDPDLLSRSARIRAYKMYQRASPEEKERLRRRMDGGASSKYRQTWTAVHLLSPEEAKSLFGDVVEGLAFLHAKSILHLDLKPGNVLLTWDEGRLIPRAMLSDFGTSRDMLNTSNVRTGNTGTLEYSSPESLPSPQTGALRTIDSKSDMWSLGMILHKLLFFKLPYHYAAAGDASGSTVNSLAEDDKMSRLEAEVLSYPGFKSTPTVSASFEARNLPHAFLILLESLLNPTPASRPPCERVLSALREGRVRMK